MTSRWSVKVRQEGRWTWLLFLYDNRFPIRVKTVYGSQDRATRHARRWLQRYRGVDCLPFFVSDQTHE